MSSGDSGEVLRTRLALPVKEYTLRIHVDPDARPPEVADRFCEAEESKFAGAAPEKLKGVLVGEFRRPAPPMFARTTLQMLSIRAAAIRGLQMLENLRKVEQFSAGEQ